MSGKNWIILIGIGLTLTMAACARKTPTPTIIPLVDKDAEIANPASVYCEQYGGTLEIRTDGTGAQTGFCIFADGSECEEWAYFRGECAPASALQDTPTPALPSSETPTTELAADGWKIYRDANTGLYFEYPPDATLEAVNGNPQALSIIRSRKLANFLRQLPLRPRGFPPGSGY